LTPVVPKPYMKGEEMMAENISWMKWWANQRTLCNRIRFGNLILVQLLRYFSSSHRNRTFITVSIRAFQLTKSWCSWTHFILSWCIHDPFNIITPCSLSCPYVSSFQVSQIKIVFPNPSPCDSVLNPSSPPGTTHSTNIKFPVMQIFSPSVDFSL
jgi:hypothetical protein